MGIAGYTTFEVTRSKLLFCSADSSAAQSLLILTEELEKQLNARGNTTAYMQKNDPARPTECKVLARVSLLMGTVKRGQEWRAGRSWSTR